LNWVPELKTFSALPVRRMKVFARLHFMILTSAFVAALPFASAQSNPDFFPYLGMTIDNNMSVVDTYVDAPAERAKALHEPHSF
jgi:hypothetical protein